jgi:hypothetical protein
MAEESATGLVYGVDRQLRDGDAVLAGFKAGDVGSYGCIGVGGREYDIVHSKKAGWRFHLNDRADHSQACEYVPFRFLFGGRFVGQHALATLRSVPFRLGRRSFSSEAGWRVTATLRNTAPQFAGRKEAFRGAMISLGMLEVHLDGLETRLDTREVLVVALGCWILVEQQIASSVAALAAPGGSGGYG